MLVKVVWPINELFSSIELQCTCKQSRILVVQVSRTTLQTRFTEQFFSTSLFTDSKNSRSRCQENKLAPLNKDNFLTHPPHLSIFCFGQPKSLRVLSGPAGVSHTRDFRDNHFLLLFPSPHHS